MINLNKQTILPIGSLVSDTLQREILQLLSSNPEPGPAELPSDQMPSIYQDTALSETGLQPAVVDFLAQRDMRTVRDLVGSYDSVEQIPGIHRWHVEDSRKVLCGHDTVKSGRSPSAPGTCPEMQAQGDVACNPGRIGPENDRYASENAGTGRRCLQSRTSARRRRRGASLLGT